VGQGLPAFSCVAGRRLLRGNEAARFGVVRVVQFQLVPACLGLSPLT